MDAGIIVALITALAGMALSGGTWYSTRQKTSAEAYDKLSATVERQDARMEQLRDEIDALRLRLLEMEAEGSDFRSRVRTLEDEVNTLNKYLRRVVRQLRDKGETPDLPPEVLKRLQESQQPR
jgi:predicted  nucleic acid-binding Zn-ribbon protein